MFGIRIGGSGQVYLSVPVLIDDEWTTCWRLLESWQYGGAKRNDAGRIFHNDPTLPHPLTGRPSDPPRCTDWAKQPQAMLEVLAASVW
jgi:hypothetical protein